MSTFAPEKKKALVLCAFGTTVPDAWATYAFIESRFAAAFPTYEIRWAFTAAFVRNKWRQMGKDIDSPATALARLADEGHREVLIQSLHIIGGYEYHDLVKTARALEGLPKGLKKVQLGRPLLSCDKDYRSVAKILSTHSRTKRSDQEAWLLMGHGTGHGANISYAGFQLYLQEEDPLILLATLEAFPDLQRAIRLLKEKEQNTVWLMPFLTVAGDHAVRDMAGAHPESWKSSLEKQGFLVKTDNTPLGDLAPIVDLWIVKAREAATSAT